MKAGPMPGTTGASPDRAALLHNMSAPPKTVVKYEGLSGLASTLGPGGSGVCGLKYKGDGVFGTPVLFVLPGAFGGQSASAILRLLGLDVADTSEEQASRHLMQLINNRAHELPLPDGCAVIPCKKSHQSRWSDALSVLAIFAKCSDTVWLRSKSPSLNAAVQRQQLTLLVPPLFAHLLAEVTP